MGTNYYFRPKGFTKIDKLNKNLKDSVSVLKEEYLKKLEELLIKTESQYKDYADLLYLTDISDLEDRVKFTVFEFETPDIHICKISAGWIPLFEVNRFYSNFNEFEEFYFKHKDNLDLINEYNEVVDFEKFKIKVFDRINSKNYQSHLQYNNSYGISYCVGSRYYQNVECSKDTTKHKVHNLYYGYNGSYYKDELGVEWTNSKFS